MKTQIKTIYRYIASHLIYTEWFLWKSKVMYIGYNQSFIRNHTSKLPKCLNRDFHKNLSNIFIRSY